MMPRKPVSRRKFLIESVAGAAGMGLLAGCDKRTPAGPDIRPPSAPKGLEYQLGVDAAAATVVNLSWRRHDLTDITGSKTEIGITGYNIYRDGVLIGANVAGTSFVDSSGVTELQTYQYTLTAMDGNGNKSPNSDPLYVAIQPRSEIFQVTDASAVGGTAANPVINGDKVKTMLHAAIRQMTGKATTPAAWESLFPVLSATTLIGIKINTLGANTVSTKPPVVDAIVDGLTQMLGGTFPAYNIIVFDDRGKDSHMKPAGFILRDEAGKYRVASTAYNTTLHGVPVNQKEADSALWGENLTIAGIPQKLSAVIESVDYLINVPVLKDHNLAGITFSLKNFYGIVDRPQDMHADMCNTHVSALYDISVNGAKVKDKVRLIVGDALIGCYSGGPRPSAGPNMIPCTLVAGTDPVAMDIWALRRINKERVLKNAPQISSAPTGEARHIFTASLAPYALGSTNCVVREVTVA
jgi:hypothetical protein